MIVSLHSSGWVVVMCMQQPASSCQCCVLHMHVTSLHAAACSLLPPMQQQLPLPVALAYMPSVLETIRAIASFQVLGESMNR